MRESNFSEGWKFYFWKKSVIARYEFDDASVSLMLDYVASVLHNE